jgi:hypothetical protein
VRHIEDLTSTAVRQGDWLVLVDPGWQETAREVMPPPEVILGGWMIGEDGVPRPFEPNPNYVPTDEALPTDPIDAVLRRSANGDKVGGEEIIAALRGASAACRSWDPTRKLSERIFRRSSEI